MHQDDIYPIPKSTSDRDIELKSGTSDAEYLQILRDQLPRIFELARPDICFVAAGCDTLSGDPLASLEMTPAGIVERDQAIIAECVRRKVPVTFLLSGGYSPEAWRCQYASIKNLIQRYQLAESQ